MRVRECRSVQGIGTFALAAVLLSACEISGPDVTAPTAPTTPTVVSISISGSAANASAGQTRSLVATATLSNNTAVNVTTLATWTTSNATVATVGGTGTVSFLMPGGVDIKATYQGVTGGLTFTVAVGAPTVTSVVVSGVGGTAAVGQTAALVATAVYSDGSTSIVTTEVSWVSSNPSVATVSAIGVVNFIGTGPVVFTAAIGGTSGSRQVEVAATVVPRSVSGVVLDGVNNRPAARVRVTVLDGPDGGRRTETDDRGEYELDELTPGAFTLEFTSSVGEFAVTTRDVTLTDDTRIDVNLNPTFDVYYGLFDISLTKTLDTCSAPVTIGATGTLLLEGRPDGSGFTAKLTERGVSRTYFGGRMAADGRFGGVLPSKTLLPGATGIPVPQHDIDGPIDGRVIGNSVSGTETLIYYLPCIGQQINISFAGTK